jgi:hypothetical protein
MPQKVPKVVNRLFKAQKYEKKTLLNKRFLHRQAKSYFEPLKGA